MKLTDGTPVTTDLIEADVEAHADRLSSLVQFDDLSRSVKSIEPDPNFADEDREGLRYVTGALANEEFRKKLCAGLRTTSGDLKAFIGPLVKFALPVTTLSGAASAVVGLQFVVVGLPFTAVAASLLGVMLARFGVSFYCHGVNP